MAADCRCGSSCQNQRFQKKEYADVEVIQTEKKGFGLRAGSAISAEAFIYEYIGEVVEESDFQKRMRRYHDERIPHFYFMMLQRDEYLDATKRGGIARFINHSCNPNCYVAKWHVGKHYRMGIFSQRDILKGEELTFNYNVDRYGNEAQPCYCGEPNCVGQLGGKTQTDIGGMSNLYIEGEWRAYATRALCLIRHKTDLHRSTMLRLQPWGLSMPWSNYKHEETRSKSHGSSTKTSLPPYILLKKTRCRLSQLLSVKPPRTGPFSQSYCNVWR
jgi:SET domain-containing protein